MAVKHIVLFRFKADASAETVKEGTSRMLSLKEGCIHPTTQKPYIKALTGGKDISIEGADNGITHAFVMEFESIEDRDHYVNNDPYHAEFKSWIISYLEKFIIVDYEEGVF
ncbi:stress responsive A/B barrel domain protein [Daldinia caldariorum]|uniref:stress responsive A/B barrel domain protein n=1 Tax=Daldinia caldariorum TaxID=326644 RepID=UPI0020089CEA|nr:stress responsive A/B barrel domain protein [Daldinia caldariorum]KAI1465192.1 stress responsive A/B barrel domain protein [Daldinia caldariorum]